MLKARLSYRLAVCHMSAMSRHLQKNDKISQLEQEAARLSSALAESMASVAAKEALLLRSETSRSLAETEVQRLSSRINEMQKHILDTAKDATSATTRLEMFTKDFQAAQDAARTASGEAAEARAKLVCSGLFLAADGCSAVMCEPICCCDRLHCKPPRKRKLRSFAKVVTKPWLTWPPARRDCPQPSLSVRSSMQSSRSCRHRCCNCSRITYGWRRRNSVKKSGVVHRKLWCHGACASIPFVGICWNSLETVLVRGSHPSNVRAATRSECST